MPAVLVVGAGPGVGRAVAVAFARDGYAVGLLGRDEDAVRGIADELAAGGTTVAVEVADLTDVPTASAAIDRLATGLGGVDVLHVNPSAYREADPLHLSVDALLEDVALGVGGLLVAVQAVRPHLAPGARVTVTGSIAADRPSPRAASLGVQKAGLRNLVRSLDATLAPDGIRAVCVTVRGTLAADGPFALDRVAGTIRAAAARSDADWTVEVGHGDETDR